MKLKIIIALVGSVFCISCSHVDEHFMFVEISGVVRTQRDGPIAGAEVRFYDGYKYEDDLISFSKDFIAEIKTDTDGRFYAFIPANSGKLTVVASVPPPLFGYGWAAERISFKFDPGLWAIEYVVLEFEPPEGSSVP